MIGLVTQYVLYVLLFASVAFSVAGIYFAVLNRRGQDISLALPVSILSIVVSTAPYVGLFGTVFHIIEALSGVGNGVLDVQTIAKPLGGAMYATLWGLGAAIPALTSLKVIMLLTPDEGTQEPKAQSAE